MNEVNNENESSPDYTVLSNFFFCENNTSEDIGYENVRQGPRYSIQRLVLPDCSLLRFLLIRFDSIYFHLVSLSFR